MRKELRFECKGENVDYSLIDVAASIDSRYAAQRPNSLQMPTRFSDEITSDEG